jgi:DNA-directed RNA polymerase specialized sigma24 family protein
VNWLKRRVHCVQDASDLAQDTYMRLLRQCPRCKSWADPDLREQRVIGGYIVTRAHRLGLWRNPGTLNRPSPLAKR